MCKDGDVMRVKRGKYVDSSRAEMCNSKILKGNRMTDEVTVENWLAIRKEEGLKIEPATAEVYWTYALTPTLMVSSPNLRKSSSK
jgi:hypothetical protein